MYQNAVFEGREVFQQDNEAAQFSVEFSMEYVTCKRMFKYLCHRSATHHLKNIFKYMNAMLKLIDIFHEY